MARQLTLAYPGDLNTLTGGYIYNKRILAELQSLGWDTHTLSLDAQFPAVDDAIKHRSAKQLAQVARDHILVIDGLALGAMGHHTNTIARPFVALVHHPLALESGIDAATAKKLWETERVALALAQSVMVTSEITKQTLVDQYAVAANNITVIEPGVDRPWPLDIDTATPTEPSKPGASGEPKQAVKLLSVGALVPRKGFDVLIKALGQLPDLDWQLTIVGDQTRAPDCATQIKGLIKALKLNNRVNLAGVQTAQQLEKAYARADLFVLASRYEGYGMAYTEALAWGLPVIGTDGGAAVQTLDTPAAMVVPVDDVQALALVLRTLISDADKRNQMRLAAHEHAKGLHSWQAAGQRVAALLEGISLS